MTEYLKDGSNLELGDIVLVDSDLPHMDGGYEAEILWVGKILAQIKVGDSDWSIMRNRLKFKRKKNDL